MDVRLELKGEEAADSGVSPLLVHSGVVGGPNPDPGIDEVLNNASDSACAWVPDVSL